MSPKSLCSAQDSPLTPDLYFQSRTRSFLHLDVSQASQSYTKATALILTPSLDPPRPAASLHQLPATPSFPVPRPQTLKSFSLLLPLPLPLPLPSLSPSSQLANAIVYCLQDPDISHPLTVLARPPIISLLDVSTAPSALLASPLASLQSPSNSAARVMTSHVSPLLKTSGGSPPA